MYWHDGFDWFWMSLMMMVSVVLISVAAYVAIRLSRGPAALRDSDARRR